MKNKVLTFGEIMLRLATPGYLRFGQATEFEASYAGGEANVAVQLANYGIPATFVTSLPKNDLGDAAIASLKSLDVETNLITRGGDRIGIYYLEAGAVSRGSKVIYDRAGSSFAKLKKGSIDWFGSNCSDRTFLQLYLARGQIRELQSDSRLRGLRFYSGK